MRKLRKLLEMTLGGRPRVLLARGAKPFDCDHRPQLDEPSPNAFHYASLREDPPLTRCPIRRVKTHLASHSWLVFGQNLPKQVNLLRAQLQELEDVLHAGVHGELGAPLRRLQLAGVPHDFRRWLQRQVPKNASPSASTRRDGPCKLCVILNGNVSELGDA